MVMGSLQEETEVAIIGGGPGGYVAALRAADLGKAVTLIEERDRLGGVCLLDGCIPSKALINAVEVIENARRAGQFGLTFSDLKVDLPALRQWCRSVVEGLAKGVDRLLQRRGVEVVKGRARFQSNRVLAIEGGGVGTIRFQHCIIATGSRVQPLPKTSNLPVWSSTEALQLPEIPERLLVVGGGYIGLELGQVYAGLGSKVTMVEVFPYLLAGADQDLVEVVINHCTGHCFEAMLLESRVIAVKKSPSGFAVTIEHQSETRRAEYDQVLVAVGRRPNTDDLGLEHTGILPDKRGFNEVTPEGRTAQPHIFASGDVTQGPMLAHQASREGNV